MQARIENIAFADHRHNYVQIYSDVTVSITSNCDSLLPKKTNKYHIEDIYYFEYNADRENLNEKYDNTDNEISRHSFVSDSDEAGFAYFKRCFDTGKPTKSYEEASNATVIKRINGSPKSSEELQKSLDIPNDLALDNRDDEILKLKHLANILFEEACKNGGNLELINKIETVLDKERSPNQHKF